MNKLIATRIIDITIWNKLINRNLYLREFILRIKWDNINRKHDRARHTAYLIIADVTRINWAQELNSSLQSQRRSESEAGTWVLIPRYLGIKSTGMSFSCTCLLLCVWTPKSWSFSVQPLREWVSRKLPAKLENVKGAHYQLKTSFSSHSLVFNNEGRKEILSPLLHLLSHL